MKVLKASNGGDGPPLFAMTSRGQNGDFGCVSMSVALSTIGPQSSTCEKGKGERGTRRNDLHNRGYRGKLGFGSLERDRQMER